MPFADVSGLRVHYRLDGPPGGPLLVLSHPLGADLSIWDPQAAALNERFRLLRYDARGHGRTTVTRGPYAIDQLATDVLGLLDTLGARRVHFCGLSMGGLLGIWLGAHAADRVGRLVLCNTAARIGTIEGWNERIEAVRGGGLAKIAPGVMERWFSPAFRQRSPELVARTRALFERTPVEGYLGWCAAIRDADLRSNLAAISAKTLVVAGRSDLSTTPADGRLLADAIPGARYLELEASHLSGLEAASAFTTAVSSFLSEAEPA